MTGGTKPGAPLPVYDAQELRRRIPVCFTIGELYRFAERLQVPETPAWSNNPQEAARDIVRHFERSGALAFLVEALRETKPLVEWPDPVAAPVAVPVAIPLGIPPAPPLAAASPIPAAPAAPAGPTQEAAPVAEAFDTADTSVDPPPDFNPDRPTPVSTVSAAALLANHDNRAPGAPGFAPAVMHRPGEARGPDAPTPAATILDPFAPPPSSAPAGPPSAKAAAPPPAVWPGTTRPRTAASSSSSTGGLDPKLLLGGGAAVLVAAVAIAFLVGRASSSSEAAESGSGSGSGAPAASGDHVRMSDHAIAALAGSMERVAKACQIDVGSLRGRSLFEVAYRRCGPLPRPTSADVRPPSLDIDPDPNANADPNANPTPDPTDPGADVKPGTGKKPAGNSKLQKVDVPASQTPSGGGSVCLSNCARSHAACTPRCGAEPQQGSQYDGYQACLGGCLKALSQCKMGCQ